MMHQPVEDGVPKRGVADHLVPVIDGQLAGHEGGAAADAVFHQFEEVAAFAVTERREAPVVEDEEVGAGEGLHQLCVAPVGASQHQFFAEEPRHAHIAHGVPLPTGAVPERTGEPRFARPGRAGDQQRLVLADPFAAGELQQPTAFEPAFRAEVHVFDARGIAQPGELEQARQAPVMPAGLLALEEQREPLLGIGISG